MLNYKYGPGISMKTAIKITGAKNELEGVSAEYYLVSKIRRISGINYKLVYQQLLNTGDKSYDLLVLRDDRNQESPLWFDITDFFGKW